MQLALDIPLRLSKTAYDYGARADGGTHGLVLTKPHVVSLILDLAGYRAEADLAQTTLLEPSCGHGAFLVQVVERLLASVHAHGKSAADLTNAITAFDIEDEHVLRAREAVAATLESSGVHARTARRLAEGWIRQGDYLLAPIARTFDVIVGNPPYIRIEQLSPELQAEYRGRYVTLFDRADLYVAFIERSLGLLSATGMLSFVCADRWTLNRYGAPLRALITSGYEVRSYVDFHRASPFESEVIAYPSVFAIAREKTGAPIRVASLTTASPDECIALGEPDRADQAPTPGVTLATYPTWFSGEDPWVLSSPEQLAALRGLEERFPLLEQDGRTFVRIGVATGNDSVYIVPSDADIEPDRLVPLVMRDDILNGRIKDGRRCVINTFETKGTVALAGYPRLRRYIERHADDLKKRHVAQKNKDGWFRTIDRVYPELVGRPKLLIPDIAGANEVAFEPGRFYPHHNLYFVISDAWDLEVLGGLLSSRVALFFVWSYAVKMRGGYLRFQAQYLRRIRVPKPNTLPDDLKHRIKTAYRARDFGALDQLACVAYGLPSLPDFDFVDARQ